MRFWCFQSSIYIAFYFLDCFMVKTERWMSVLGVLSSLSLCSQDGWPTLVSGLVAIFWLWNQHSQLHCLGKHLLFFLCPFFLSSFVSLLPQL